MTPEERATVIRARLHNDMVKRLGGFLDPEQSFLVVEAVDEAMFQIEHLLVEIAGLEQQLAVRDRNDYE